MIRRVNAGKYHIVHIPTYVHAMLVNFKLQLNIEYVRYISTVVLVVAIGLGLYSRWAVTYNTTLLIFIIMGLFVFGISCALRYYFSYEQVGQALTHLWLGSLLGMIVFTETQNLEYFLAEQVMNALLLTSLTLSCFWNVLERWMHLVKYEPTILTQVEVLESIGLVAGSLVTPSMDAISLTLLIIAFCTTVVAIRLKSLLGVLNLLVLVVVSVTVFFPSLKQPVNPYGLCCFAGRLVFHPIVDLYFSTLSTLERWNAFLSKPRPVRHLAVLGVLLLNLSFSVVIGQLSANHKEWYIVVPIFVGVAIIWLCFHVIFFISTWKLMSKITDCNLTYHSLIGPEDSGKNLNRVMSSKGVRHFSIISQRLICFTLITTVVLIGIGWEMRTGYSLGLALIILPIESMTLSLFWELGSFLGGTCTGYALVAPANLLRPAGGPKLLTAANLQDTGSRSTLVLNLVQRFFSYHMIDSYGCDYSTSGLSMEYVDSKLKAFFDRRTNDGPRYDTYILFYSGDVYDTGDWALADNCSLKLETILEWWRIKNMDLGARLILVLDTLHSYHWAKEVSYLRESFVAVQTCKFTKSPDPESGGEIGIGDFMRDWVHYNLDCDLNVHWSDKSRVIKSVFGLSRNWTDFSFHLPTEHDIAQHWQNNFPKLTRPLIRAMNFPHPGSMCCCCDCFTRCLKRKKMKWLPPREIDTGHGFKLVRS